MRAIASVASWLAASAELADQFASEPATADGAAKRLHGRPRVIEW